MKLGVEHCHGFPITSLSICRCGSRFGQRPLPTWRAQVGAEWCANSRSIQVHFHVVWETSSDPHLVGIQISLNFIPSSALRFLSSFEWDTLENRKKIVFEAKAINHDPSVTELLIMTGISFSLWLWYNFRIVPECFQ